MGGAGRRHRRRRAPTTPLSDTAPLGPAVTATAGTSTEAARSDARPAWVNPDWDAAAGTVGAIANKPTIPDADTLDKAVDSITDLTGIVLDDFYDRETGVSGTDVVFNNRNFKPINAVGYKVESDNYVLESDDYNDIAVRGSELLLLMDVDQLQTPASGNHLSFALTDGVDRIGYISIGVNLDDRPMVSLNVNRTIDGLRLLKLTPKPAAAVSADISGLDSAAALPPVADHSGGDLYLVNGVVYQLDDTTTNLIAGITEIRGRNPARVGVGDFEWGADYYSVLIPSSAFAGAAPGQTAGQFRSLGPTDPRFTADLAFMRDNSLDAGAKLGYSIRTGAGSTIEPNIGAGDHVEVRLYLDDARTMPLVISDTAQWRHFHSDGAIPEAQVQSDWTESDTANVAYIRNKPTIPAAQIQADWDQSDQAALDYIENKPTIPAAQIQADWDQSDIAALDYIENKPSLPTFPAGPYPNNKDIQLGPTGQVIFPDVPATAVSGSDVDHAVYEATAPLSLASPATPSGAELDFTIGASTVDAGMGITIASNRVTVDAGAPDRLYSIAYDIEVEALTFVNNASSGGNRLFFDVYAKVNGVVDEATRHSPFNWFGGWAPNPWRSMGSITAKLSAGDYVTLHLQRRGALGLAGSEVLTWRVNAAGSTLKVTTQHVSGGGGDPSQPAANLDYTQKLITYEEIPSVAAPATTTFVAVGSGSTLYYRSTNPFGASAGLVYLDYYPTGFGGGGQLAGTYVASTNLNVAQTDRVPDILRVVTRDYQFSPLGVPSSTVAMFQTPRVAATDRVTSSDLTKTMDVQERSKQWKRGSAPTTAQRTLDKEAIRQIAGEATAVAAIVADANTPAGTRYRLTHQQTIKGHGLLTPGDNADGSKVGWIAGSVGTLRDADGSANTGTRTSGSTPRASEIVSEPSRHVSSVLSASAAPTPAWVTVDGIRYETTAEAVSGSNQVFEFSDGTRFIEGQTYAINLEWSDGTFEWPDRVLQPGLYTWDGHRIVADPDNLSEASLAPYVKGAALAGGERWALADLPIYIVAAPPTSGPDGLYLSP